MKASVNQCGIILREVPNKYLLRKAFWDDLLDDLKVPASRRRITVSTSWDSQRQIIQVRQDIYFTDKTVTPKEAVATLKRHGFDVVREENSPAERPF
ncbi:MAG: hypothetical protein WAL32_04290 [Terriglobales bacterium]